MSDLIDKQAAIDAMQKLIITDDEEGLMFMEYNQAVSNCIDKVAELLPVEQKQGKWIYCYTNGFGRQILKCSKCSFKGDTLVFNYCPNCGAKMGGEQE